MAYFILGLLVAGCLDCAALLVIMHSQSLRAKARRICGEAFYP